MKTLEELGISPAPWSVDADNAILDSNGDYVIDDDLYFVEQSVTNANRRLIKSAPKMYKALLECERKLAAIEPYYRNLLKMVREVLEEAGGAE